MYLGIDVGTGSTKAVLVGADGAVTTSASSPYPVHAPRSGWAESAAEDWWAAVVAVVREVTAGRTVTAVSFSGQMHGAVLLDEALRPVRAPILWPDTRSLPQVAAYRALQPAAQRRLANPLTTGKTGPAALWVRDNEPDAFARTRWIVTVKDYIRARMTGWVHAEPSDASGTLLFDVAGGGWDDEVASALGLSADLLPGLVPSDAPIGELSAAAAAELGLAPGIPVIAGGADTACAIHGARLEVGEVLLTIGTGGQIVRLSSAPPPPAPELYTYRAVTDRTWYTMAAMQNAGLAFEWALSALAMSWEEAYESAFSVPAGSDGVLFDPYVSGEGSPRMDPRARAAWVGLGLEHGRAHLARSMFEGVAFGLKAGFDALPGSDGPIRSVRVAGGGAQDPRWLQLLADVFGVPLIVADVPSAAAQGAARLAAAGIGDPDPRAAVVPGRVIEPGSDGAVLRDRAADFEALYTRLAG